MKYYIVLLVFLSVFSLNAQRPGNGGGSFQRGGQGGRPMQENRMERPKPQAFDAYKAAGIVYHDIDKVIKKLKIKKKNKELKVNVENAILKYHHSIEEIGLSNKDNLDSLNVYMKNVAQLLQARKDMGKMKELRGSVREKIRPVRRSVMQEERKLNDAMALLLDDKQLKRWQVYLEELKASLNPRRNRENMPGRNNSGNFQRDFDQRGNGQRMQDGGQGFGGGL